MQYIDAVFYKDLLIPLVDESKIIAGENVYSVMVGQNGSGKSSILKDIVHNVGDEISFKNESYSFPNKIIAISTSPFDRFPISLNKKNERLKERYHYIGMKNSGGRSSAITLISKATIGLITSFGANNNGLLSVFHCMKLNPVIIVNWKSLENIRVKSDTSKEYNKAQLEFDHYISQFASSKPEFEATLFTELMSNFNDYFRVEDIPYLTELNQDELSELIWALELFQSSGLENNIPSIELNFTQERIKFVKSPMNINDLFGFNGENLGEFQSNLINAVVVLSKHNVLKINDIRILRTDERVVSLRRASSGEQCMLVIMLGIAGYLENNSVVLIDEPEISLHPEWQEDFINVLMKCFSEFSGCHFIIATHSPQILAKLSGENCFAINLEKNRLFSSSFFSEKSSDFQLAEIFDAPGPKNEYIIRISFDLIAKIRSRKIIDTDIERDFLKLLELKGKLERSDPVRDLIWSVEELRNHYANN